MCIGDVCYCSVEGIVSDSFAKSYRKCKHFEFNELDAFDIDKKYKPRKIKGNRNQISLF